MYKETGGVERRRFKGNPDFRHRSQIPGPEIEEVETRLYELLDPSLMAPRQMERRDPNDPDRPIPHAFTGVNVASDDGDHR
jgi:hypothetical protein